MKAVIITEGGKSIGFGHITRCSAFYDVSQKHKINPLFIIHADDMVKSLLKDRRYEIFNWLKETKKLFALIKNVNVVIIDSYLAGASFYKKISDLVDIPIYIDDNKRIDYPPGIVVNGAIYAKALNYPRKKDVTYLLGTKYTPLRKEFWEVPDKQINKNIEQVLVTFGGNDERNLTPRILKFLQAEYPQFIKYIVIGKGFCKINEIEALKDKNTNLVYYPDAHAMKKLMLRSDLAISAGGQTLYELAWAGVPTIAICVSENQERNLLGWKKANFTEYIGNYNHKRLIILLKKSIDKLRSFALRAQRSQIGMSLVDGKGVERVLQIAMDRNKLPFRLREARENDCFYLWLWRNRPEVRKWCFNAGRIPYGKHKEWFVKKMSDYHTTIYIVEGNTAERIGQIRFEANKDKEIYVNTNLNPKFFDRGLGNKIIKEGTELFMKDNPGARGFFAEILSHNFVSKKAFQKAGYVFSHNILKDGRKIEIFKLEANR